MKTITLGMISVLLLCVSCAKKEGTPQGTEPGTKPADTAATPGKAEDDRAGDEALQAKLDPYIECINRHSERVHQSHARYLSWIKDPEAGPTCKEKNIYGLHTVYEPKDCDTAVRKGNAATPRVAKLEEAGTAYVTALKQVFDLTKQADCYYEQEDYKDDGCAGAKGFHPKLTQAFGAFEKADEALRGVLDGIDYDLKVRHLNHVLKAKGKGTIYYYSKVLLDAKVLVNKLETQMEQEISDLESIRKPIQEFEATVAALEEASKKDLAGVEPDQMEDFLEKVAEFVKPLKDLRRLEAWNAKNKEKRVDIFKEVIDNYNDMIESANDMPGFEM